MSRAITSISILKKLQEEAVKAAKNGKFPGASSFSAIVELALDRLLHPENYALSSLEELGVLSQVE